MQRNFDPLQLREQVGQSRNILVTSHHNPDGDAIGSVLALTLLLKKLGCNARAMVPNEFPGFLKWMPGHEDIAVYKTDRGMYDEWIANADLVFCLDYNALSRTGDMEAQLRQAKGSKVLIDHHLDPALADFDLYYSLIAISSTAELVYRFIIENGWEHLIDKDIATALFVGIMTDTGSFSFSCGYPETFEVSAALIRKGIDPEAIHRMVYDTYSENRLRLLGYCLSEKLTILPEFKTAYIALSKDELYRFRYQVGDTEGVVNYALSIENINLAVFLTERKDRIRLSFRSRGDFSVNQLARDHFNGGGHRNASGGDSFLTLEQTEARLRQILEQYRDDLNRY